MNDVARECLLVLVRTTLFLSLAGGLVWLVMRVSRPTTPAVSRVAWAVVVLVGWSFVRVSLPVRWYDPPTALLSTAQATEPGSAPPIAVLPPVDASEAAVDAPLSVSRSSHISAARQSATPLGWPLVVLGVWALGMIGLTGAGLVGYTRFVCRLPKACGGETDWHRQWRELLTAHGMRLSIPLRVTAYQGPALCRLPSGYALLVPAGLWSELDAAERLTILRHELAHYERGDVWKSLALRCLALPHWFNPFVWLAVYRFEEAAEWACDRVATGDGPATVYAKALMRLGEVATRPALYGSMAGGRTLAARIRRLLESPREDSTMKKTMLISGACALAGLAVVQVRLVAKEPVPAATADAQLSEPQPPPATSPQPASPTVSPYLNELQAEGRSSGAVVHAAQAEPQVDVTRQKAIQKVVAEAQKAYEATLKAYEADNAVLDEVYVWSTRWMNAASADGKAAEAAQAHLQRMVRLARQVTALQNARKRVGGIPEKVAAARFYVAEAERKAAESAGPMVKTEGAAPLSISASGTIAVSGMVFDGKSFSEWATTMRTDLSPEQRRRALWAIGEFGAHGEGPAAARAIVAMMADYTFTNAKPTGAEEDRLKATAMQVVKHIPAADIREPLEEAANSGNANQRLFALHAAMATLPTSNTLPMLLHALDDKEPLVRMAARRGLASADRRSPKLAPSLLAALAGSDQTEVLDAISIVSQTMISRINDPLPVDAVDPIDEVIPGLAGLLGSKDPAASAQAENCLWMIEPRASAVLTAAVKSGDPAVAAKAQEALARFQIIKAARSKPRR